MGIRLFLSVICFTGLFLSVSAEGQIPEMPVRFRADPAAVVAAAKNLTAARFPDADMVTIDDRIHTSYEADGSDATWDDEWIMALTERGRRALASVSIGVSFRYGDAAIQCVEIVGTNGVIRPVDFRKTLKTATDNQSMGMNIYDPLDKKIVCAVPGLEVGEIRHVRTCRRALKARMKGTWSDISLLEYTFPILATTVTIDQPDTRPIVHAVLRHPFTNTVKRAANESLGNGRTLLSWTARDVPQAFPEPNMPPLHTQVQSLLVSTMKDWPTVSRWYWNLCLPHLDAASPAMTNEVARLVRGCRTPDEKMRALFKFVSQEIRYMGLTTETESPGYEPHDVRLTFGNRYGVCRDKAALLTALLRIGGFTAYPVLIHAGAKIDPEVPSPYFNHAIVAIEIPAAGGLSEATGVDGKYLLMDPTDESARDIFPSYLSNRSYLVARPEGEDLRVSPVVPAGKNLLSVKSDGSLAADGSAVMTYEIAFGGLNDNAFRDAFLRKTDLERRQLLTRFLQKLSPGAELLEFELSPGDLRNTDVDLSARLRARLYHSVLPGRTRDELSLPLLTRVLNLADLMLDENTALERRRFPLVFSSTVGTEETLRLSVGSVLGPVRTVPPDLSAASDGGGFTFSRALSVKDGLLTASRKMTLKAVEFGAPAYGSLRETRKLIESGERANPLFAARKNADANTRLLRYETATCFRSPKVWTSTNIIEREILTYQGKKKSAELKFTYSPCTRAVELVSATVSNRNGKVFSVAPSEINVMDAGWVASAPRYPASKILVVNLPGVEIGSVIRTTVVRTVTNAPVAFSESYAFGEEDPIVLERLAYHVPADLPFAVRAAHLGKRVSASVVTNADGSRVFAWTARNSPRVPRESSQPPAAFWRPTVTASAADWSGSGRELVSALARARAGGSEEVRRQTLSLIRGLDDPSAKISVLRAFLAKNIRVTGPGLYELPFDRAFTPPDQTLTDSYASGTDWMNLFAAMLDAAGFSVELVSATNDALGFHTSESSRRKLPRPNTFGTLLIRATSNGTVFWLSRENEYTPPEASSCFGHSFYDPLRDTFGRVAPSSPDGISWWAPWTWFGESSAVSAPVGDWGERSHSACRMTVRTNGAVDFDVTNRTWGAAVGPLRKRFAEMVPELRDRFYQQLVGTLARNATATSELVTDTQAYPFVLSFSAYVPEYAVIQGDALTVRLPDFDENLFAVDGPSRESPFAIRGAKERIDTYEVIFPKGYTAIEHLPESFTLTNPSDRADVWVTHRVSSRIVDGVRHVTVTRRTARGRAVWFTPDYFTFFRDWNRRAAAPAARTLTVRRVK